MKYRQFIMTDDDTYAANIAKRSKMLRETISAVYKHFTAIENIESVGILDKNVIFDTNWFILANGRYIAQLGTGLIKRVADEHKAADVILLMVENDLMPYRENMRIKSNNEVAGYRRFFFDSILPDEIPEQWPHYILIKASALNTIIDENGTIPVRFCIFIKRCVFAKLKIKSLTISGRLFDLGTEEDTLLVINNYLHHNGSLFHPNACIAPHVHIYGSVLIDENAFIENGATIIGPAIIGPHVKISASAVIYRSIVFLNDTAGQKYSYASNKSFCNQASEDNYRTWPLFSYPRFWKRLCDITVSLTAIPLLFIIFISIAAAVKCTSRGPVFFKHKRQGLRGKTFLCLKFRTMIINADDIQEKLKYKNQVDGPQFKIDDDPRVTIIGRFLRDTHLDEIPQFINILLGQMSLIGPRPSPAKENSFCSYWRDARLSVRPGITGLWQINRTRKEGQDFQEWIYYDTQYVKNISFPEDLKIFFKTVIKLTLNFFKHF